jgi:hypothetical protein
MGHGLFEDDGTTSGEFGSQHRTSDWTSTEEVDTDEHNPEQDCWCADLVGRL